MFELPKLIVFFILLIFYVLCLIAAAFAGIFVEKDTSWSPGDPSSSRGGAAGCAPPQFASEPYPENVHLDPVLIENSEILTYGIPNYNTLIFYEKIKTLMSYNNELKEAHWTLERLTKDMVCKDSNIKWNSFKQDKLNVTLRIHRAGYSDYKHASEHRGHLAAAANHTNSLESYKQTYFYTNVVPMIPEFNTGAWKSLEFHVRQGLELNKYQVVFVLIICLFLEKTDDDELAPATKYKKTNTGMAVPSHFAKVLVGQTAEGELDMESYLMPHEKIRADKPLKDFMVHPEEIEDYSSLPIFQGIHRSQLRELNGLEDNPDKEYAQTLKEALRWLAKALTCTISELNLVAM